MATELKHQRVRFAEFEFDCSSGELLRGGVSMKLQPQPAKVLAVLIRSAGNVVTRQELANEMWGSGTFVDFEQGLNYAIRQIRASLGDDADQPRFLETLPKRGYRFIAELDGQLDPEVTVTAITAPKPKALRRTMRVIGMALILVIVTGVAFVMAFRVRGRLLPATPNHPITSLAVLPLHNLSNDPDQDYFSDGITEELITDLAKSANLHVISRTSVQRYKITNRSLPEIARELGADAIVEGAVVRSNNRVRITAQLIDARSDQHLWADSYEGDLQDMLSLQDEVAQRIATQVGITIHTNQETRVVDRQVNSAAYDAYLKGNFYWNRSTCDGSNKGRSFYQKAVLEDPTFAPAYAGLAQAYFVLGDWGCSPREQAFSESRTAALEALELDPTSGPAHAWLGALAYFHDKELEQCR